MVDSNRSTSAVPSLNVICREKLIAGVCSIVTRWKANKDVTADNVGIVLSGGVDTSAVMEAIDAAFQQTQVFPKIAITVYASEEATDIPYAPLVVHKFASKGLEHVQVNAHVDELLEESLTTCIKELASFDGMQLRNSVVIARALIEAKKLGLKYLFTGDASDELLGGYSFTWNTDEPVWSTKRAEMCSEWMFSGPILAQSLSIHSDSPFCEPVFSSWALNNTQKHDCIAERHCESSPGEIKQFRTTGKVVLREAFADSVSAWRRKDPIEVGSGSTLLGKNNGEYFNGKLDRYDEEEKRIKVEDGITIRSPEHLFYYNRFLQVFPKETWKSESSSILPNRLTAGQDHACLECSFELYNHTAMFCRVCGAWPARQGATVVVQSSNTVL